METIPRSSGERAQAAMLGIAVALAAVFLLGVLGAVGGAYVAHAELQQAADVAAASAELPIGDDPRAHARRLARANGATRVEFEESGTFLRIMVSRPAPYLLGIAAGSRIEAEAEAQLPIGPMAGLGAHGGMYSGPLVIVDGVPICPAVGADYLRMQAAARSDGVTFHATSGYRSVAEQAVLYAQLGPGIAAPPGTSLHHAATEFDIGVGPAGSAIHRWLSAHGPTFGFIQRYSWEPWHWGNVRGC